ncbi:MAG: pantetheine-phosphate adenylyltransferase [Bacteroidales bacterium]|nr:pantetheine-phosphate adenylyltransferase [Bacteroidales bacterium]
MGNINFFVLGDHEVAIEVKATEQASDCFKIPLSLRLDIVFMKRLAVFPGSFDPFTLGHLDVLKSALELFDGLTVAVGYNTQKSGLFSPEDRVEMIKIATAGYSNIEVCSYTGLTVNFCVSKGIHYIVRGLRTTTDFELEQVIAQANQKMAPEIKTVFIPAGPEFSFISSTVVRDVLLNGGDAKRFIPPGIDLNKFVQFYK